jgi:hypothetical protein
MLIIHISNKLRELYWNWDYVINYVNYTETQTTWRTIPSGLTVHQQGYIYLINYVNYTEPRTTWRMIPSGLTVHQQGYINLINYVNYTETQTTWIILKLTVHQQRYRPSDSNKNVKFLFSAHDQFFGITLIRYGQSQII